VLYNNAGIGYSATSRMGIGMDDVVRCSLEDWNRILDINLGGVFHFCKYGIPALIERGGGAIINTASIAALKGSRNAHAYGASKGAIVALTRSLAVTYGRNGIRANAICPGIIDTEMIHDTLLGSEAQITGLQRMTPLGAIGTALDIANVALFLASDAGKFVTGQAIPVDGGITA
jgi:meso-butanediol dehydrogenase/(S,S)-butanediol dehydrogenase/diacetyl reductase